MSSVVMTAIGVLMFGDKLNKRQWIGIVFGISAVVLLSMQFSTSFSIA